jgi:hypothetical protein
LTRPAADQCPSDRTSAGTWRINHASRIIIDMHAMTLRCVMMKPNVISMQAAYGVPRYIRREANACSVLRATRRGAERENIKRTFHQDAMESVPTSRMETISVSLNVQCLDS